MCTPPQSPRLATLEHWLEELWTKGNLDVLNQMYAPDAEAEGFVMEGTVTRRDMEDMVTTMRAHVIAPRFHILRAIDCGEWLTVVARVDMTARSTGQAFSTTGQMLMRFEAGRIAESYNHFTLMTLFEQPGLLPKGALALCLSGETLG